MQILKWKSEYITESEIEMSRIEADEMRFVRVAIGKPVRNNT